MQKMVSRIFEQQQANHQVLHDDCKYRYLVPTWQDIDVLESLNVALGTLSDFVTISAILPVIHHILKREVLSIGDDDTQLTKISRLEYLAILNRSTLMLKFVSYFLGPSVYY